MEVRRLSFHHARRSQESSVQFNIDLGLGLWEGPEPSPAPSKIFVPEQHIYIDKPGF